MSAIARRDVPAAEGLLADDVVAVVPQAGDAPLRKAELLSWIGSSTTGTTRLDLYDVVAATPTAVGARVLHTAFAAPPPSGQAPVTSQDAPSWETWPTIVAGTTAPDGTSIASLFLITDDADEPSREAMVGVVREWYEAYVAQDVEGFLRPLAPKIEAVNYTHGLQPTKANWEEMRKGYEQWIRGNTKGGYVIDGIVARGRYVGVAVQFLTVSKENGQQKMTNEIHVFEMTGVPQMLRSYYWYTSLCGFPDAPCAW